LLIHNPVKMKNTFLILTALVLLCSADGPKLVHKKIAEGVSVSLPKNFYPMSDDDVAQRYPSTKKPLAMYTDLDRAVDFGLNISKSNWVGTDLKVLQGIYKSTILSLYNKVNFIQEGVKNIKGRDYIVFEFTSEADNTPKYTYLQYAVVNTVVSKTDFNKVFIFNFSCAAAVMDKWKPVAAAIMGTVNINARETGKNLILKVPNEKKGVDPKKSLEQQKQHNPKNK
jgi:hypothetical protein